ncbi:MAG: SpoIIE family protein phosphatase, partial [Clostridia bacterium]|nr:SpoIIE family protein phosphatase [Clostridia bacterium]
NIHCSLLGAVLGCMLLQRPLNFPAAAVCLAYYLLHLLWRRWRGRLERFDRLLLLFIAEVALLPVFYSGGLQRLLMGLIGLCVAVFSSLIIQNALKTLRALPRRHVLSDGEQVSISAFFGVVLLSVTDVQAFGFSLPVALLLLYAMVTALARGVAGVAMSVSLAVVLASGGSFSLSFVGGIAACALAGAMLRRLDTLGVLGGFIGASLLVGTYVFTASHTINLLNLAASGAAFLMIPRAQMLQLCAYLDDEKNHERFAQKAMRRLRVSTAAEMRQTARVCREMAGLFKPGELENEPSDALMQWTAQAAYGVCADCSLKKICWHDRQRAAESIVALLAAHERGERLRIRRPFEPSCKHMQQMAAAAWQAQNQYLVQRAMKKQSNQQYAFINRQLSGVGEVLEQLSERVAEDRWLDEELEHLLLRGLDRMGYRIFGVDASFPHGKLMIHLRMPAAAIERAEALSEAVCRVLRRRVRLLNALLDGRQCTFVFEEAQAFSSSMGTATLPISASGVSGDSTGERRLERGRVLYALSDGMGAGEIAKNESEVALRFLFDMYGAGFDRDIALESVNKLLLERSADMYATLDAVFLDLRSGSAEFIKYGAPPSFVYRGSRLHTISSEALPAGIVEEAVPAISAAKLRRNDAVILFSDGALDALGDATKDTIAHALARRAEAQEAAERILAAASERSRDDDMTVMVIKIA